MDPYGEIVKYIVHPLWMLKDRKIKLFSYLKQFEQMQHMSPLAIKKNQMVRIKQLLSHAYQNCPFYRSRFDTIGLTPSDIKDFSDYSKVPYLTKSDIQSQLSNLTATNYNPKDLVENKTGGSTGKPLRYFHDKTRLLSMEASAIRHDRWARYDIGEKIGVIWGHRGDVSAVKHFKGQIRNNFLDRKKFLDTSSITEEKMATFVKTLRRFQPSILLAYANSMYIFAKYCRETKVMDIRPKSIITSAEVLHDHERALIEEVFGCKVFNRYGCREVSVIASECDQHNGLHINADALYLEIIKDDGTPASFGESGNIIVTDLYNYGMPFIRYKIEDIGMLCEKECGCGRGLPLMENVTGRVTDFLITPERVKVSGASTTIYIIANTPGVRQAQFIQNKIDEIKLKIVRGKEFNDDSIQYLKKIMPEFFGPKMNVEFEFVANIPKEPSGKYRFSICNLK